MDFALALAYSAQALLELRESVDGVGGFHGFAPRVSIMASAIWFAI